jgi:hypothetical protein
MRNSLLSQSPNAREPVLCVACLLVLERVLVLLEDALFD